MTDEDEQSGKCRAARRGIETCGAQLRGSRVEDGKHGTHGLDHAIRPDIGESKAGDHVDRGINPQHRGLEEAVRATMRCVFSYCTPSVVV